MEVKNIILFVVIIILLIIAYNYIMRDVNTLTQMKSGQEMTTINPSSLASSSSGSSTGNYTYSIWFFVDNWNYRYGEEKIIFGRMITGSGTQEPCPSVTLGSVQNNIDVALAVYPGLDEEPEEGSNFVVHKCSIANVPIQKWCNLLISTYGRSLDIYLDGKLVRTCVLPGVAKVDSNAPVFVTPMGGFSGWTARFQYWPQSTNPQGAWNIYRKGYGGSIFGALFQRYSVKVSLMDGDTEDSSFTI